MSVSARHRIRLNGSSASLALIAAVLFTASAAQAQQIAANFRDSDSAGELETVVVTGTLFDPDDAPAKSSLETMEPQTIINRSYIEDSVAPTADYTTILAIAPSMTGLDMNGPGLSDNGVKNTLRGLPDGMFGLTYDGIPIGDTNGPTHHSESYFPASTIGSIAVDRGPGNAGNLGASTYGGSVNMFSEALRNDPHFKASATYGSWQTSNFNVNYQTGDLDLLGTTRMLFNFQDTNSNGYLTLQTTSHTNELIKIENEFAQDWMVTFFASYNGLYQHVNDNAGATAAQVVAYGKNFGLQNTNPKLGTFQAYNDVDKDSDNDYIRLRGKVWEGFSIDNTVYTYAYRNRTASATSPEQTSAEILAGVTDGLGTTVGGVKLKNDVPGYTKLNEYRVWGNVLRAAQDFDYGWLTGQLRAGVWWEGQATQRERNDYDATLCYQQNCKPYHFDPAALGDSSLAAKGKAVTLPGGYEEYNEHSGWNQYQPFFELELHPLDGLTVTPGFKYVDWTHTTAGYEQKSVPLVPYQGSFRTTRDLPFLMANYKLQSNWSVYAQYAQGVYVPDISAFEQKTGPTLTFPKAETTTNYQVGTVYYGDNFTVDGDLYYIGINNNYVSQNCNAPPILGPVGETCFLDTGTAYYKGVEGEATYAFNDAVFGGALDGLSVFANGSINGARSGGKILANAPTWTEASGLVYKDGIYKLSLVNKLVGPQYSDNADSQFYKLHSYSNIDFKGSVAFGTWELGLGIYNLLGDRDLAEVKINDAAPIGGSSVYDLANRGGSLDQYYFKPSRSYQVTLKTAF